MIEFALVVPLFALFLFAIVDFGLLFAGYTTLRAGVQAGARLASVDQYLASDGGSYECTGSGTDTYTADMVCLVAQRVGTTLGTKAGTLGVGVRTDGTDVTVCASAAMQSTTGLLSPFLDGRYLTASSTIRIEQQPLRFTSFEPGSSASPSVTYAVNGSSETIEAISCPAT
ncbi:MAG: pilus assembly protein [Actinomycetota bacterium]|nr:pilus assembly protein [Actinomycetota bacterium]